MIQIPELVAKLRDEICLDPGICRSDFLEGLPCSSCDSFEQAYAIQEKRYAGVVEALKLIMPEVYCLMQQIKHPKRLDMMKPEDGSVPFAYYKAKEALAQLKEKE